MFAIPTATRKSAFTNVKVQRLNYEGDVKTLQNPVLGYNISFDPKTGMPIGVTTPQTKKAFCKVCHDAGKPESIYTSHFVRAAPSPDAPVVCPTLLAQPCRYCGVAGHTVKYCPGLQAVPPVDPRNLLQQVPPIPNQQEFQADFVKKAKKVSLRLAKDEMERCVNAYAALAIASSDDEDEKQSGRSSPDYSPPKEDAVDEHDELLNLYGDMNVLSKHSLVSILEVLKPFRQTSNYHVVQLCFCLEVALAKKDTTTRAPFCSPLPTPNKPIAPLPSSTIEKKDWADCDEELDYSVSIPNFPPLPAPVAKRTYAQMAKQ